MAAPRRIIAPTRPPCAAAPTSRSTSPLPSPPAAGPAEVDRRTWTVHEGTPPEGAPLPFRLGVPPDAHHARVAGLPAIRFDPEQARAALTVDPIQITIAEERREQIGPCLVAALEWPSLGLDLRLAERRWTDFGQRLPGLPPDLQKRFTLRAREAAQAAHLLGPALCAALTAAVIKLSGGPAAGPYR